jgi:hypothetical protein
MAHIFCVSCVEEVFMLLKEKNISPSEAFKVGVLKLANEEFKKEDGVKIESETDKAQIEKLKRANYTLQEELLKLSDVLEQRQKKE